MGRRRARLLEQERDTGPRLERVERHAEQRDGDVDPVARELLSLQSQAGNEAVSTMVVQRDEAQPADAGGGAKKKGVATLVLDGVRAPMELTQFSWSSKELSVTMHVPAGAKDLIDLESSHAKIEHATLTIEGGYTIDLTNLSVKSLRFQRPDQAGAPEGHDVELMAVTFSFESSKPRDRDKTKPEDTDDWKG